MVKRRVTGYYEIRYPIPKPTSQDKKFWLRIGSATQIETGHILCSIGAVPLNWDGTFHLFPSDSDKENITNEE